jgi:amino acid efflux transporter
MSRLNQELGLLQGIGLLSTSLLGTGIFVIPALAATAAGEASLWAWMLLIALVLPVAFTFAQLGRHFPHAGGAPHLIGRAFGPRMERLSALLFLAVLPVGLPAALNIASGFWQALFDLSRGQALAIQLATLAAMLLLGQRPAKASGVIQGAIAVAIIATIALIWWVGDLPVSSQPLLPPIQGSWHLLPAALGVMFWCFVGIEAFTHMGEEFKNPERDFPLALLFGVLLAGLVYWACSVAVLSFQAYGDVTTDAASLPRMLDQLPGDKARWIAANIGDGIVPPTHWLPSSQAFVDATIAGLGWGLNPDALVAEALAAGKLVPLKPDSPYDVPLYWHWSRSVASALRPLNRAVLEIGRRMLVPPEAP